MLTTNKKKTFYETVKRTKKRTGGPQNEKSRFFVYFFFGRFVQFLSLAALYTFCDMRRMNSIEPTLSQLRTLEQWAYILSASLVHSNGLGLYTIIHIGHTHLIGTKTISYTFFRVVFLSLAALFSSVEGVGSGQLLSYTFVNIYKCVMNHWP